MSVVFTRTLRSIETDGYRRSTLVFLVTVMLAASWAAWFLFARVAVVEVAETARLEVGQAAHSVEAPVAGRIASIRMVLGQEVRAGEVVAELDTEALRLSVNQEQAKQTAFTPQIAALTQEIAAEERALEDHRKVAQARSDESRAHQRELTSAVAFAEGEHQRAVRLRAEGVGSDADVAKAKADTEQRRAMLEGAQLATSRIEAEQRAAETERSAVIASRRKELAQLEGQRSTSAATLMELAHAIERRQIRAPIAGRVGEVAPLGVGGVVKEGDRLGAIIPSGTIRIVGEFLPAAAVARVKPGQSAHMRPDGFPWTEYGMLAATVRRVADEPRSGKIRVELDVNEPHPSRIPIQHGLPGTLEIEIERVSPATMVFRAAGRRLSDPATTGSTTTRL